MKIIKKLGKLVVQIVLGFVVIILAQRYTYYLGLWLAYAMQLWKIFKSKFQIEEEKIFLNFFISIL